MTTRSAARFVRYPLAASALLASGVAAAQYTPPPPPPPPPVAYGPATVDATKDHSKVIGSFGVGWFGISDVPIGAGTNGDRGNVAAPVLGVRYWLNDMLGIDAGLGFNYNSSSKKANGGGSLSQGSEAGFLLHGGVPLALSTGKHVTWEIVPEANIGFATGSGPDVAGASADLSGFKLELGARAGAEIQFGFMGLPELALEGSVGLYLRAESWKTKQGNTEGSGSSFTLATSSFNQPWDFFRGNVAARYYF